MSEPIPIERARAKKKRKKAAATSNDATGPSRGALALRWLGYVAVSVTTGALFAAGGEHTWTVFGLDDAYIHHVYAEGLAYGDGFAYDPGVPAAGTTSPLYALLLMPLHAIGLGEVALVVTTKLLGLLLVGSTAFVADRFASRFAAGLVAVVTGLLVAIDPWLIYGALAGMETPLAGLLALGAAWQFARGHVPTAGLLLGAALLARPELLVLTVVIVGWRLYQGRTIAGAWHDRAWLVGPTIVLGAAWSLYCMHVTDLALPTTFYAKHPDVGLLAQFADLGGAALALVGGPWLGVLAFAALYAVSAYGEHVAWLLAACALAVIALAWAHDLREPTRFFWMRYAMPFRPLLLVMVGLGVGLVHRRGFRVAVLIVVLLGTAEVGLRARTQLHASCRNIAETDVAAARWLDEHARPGEWIASADAGAVRLLTRRPVVDLVGLNDHRVLRDRAGVLEARRPRYYVVFEAWFPNLVRSPRTRIVARFRSEPYVICEECEQSELLVLER